MKYAKSQNGLIHLVSAVHGEYTMCGDAFEGYREKLYVGLDETDGHEWTKVKHGPVTCPGCILQIRQCRSVRAKSDNTIQ